MPAAAALAAAALVPMASAARALALQPVELPTAHTLHQMRRRLRHAGHNEAVLRNGTELSTVAALAANDERELIFTTVTMDRGEHQLVMLRQWAGNLGRRIANTLIIGTTMATCKLLRNASLPCYVDKLAPAMRGKQNGFGPQVMIKWWYAHALTRRGYHILFSDPDVAWVRDPFGEAWDRSYHLQGLSDIYSTNLTVQRHHEITCMRGWMEGMYEHSRRSIYPCQSTGLWYARASAPVIAFFSEMYDYLLARPNEWEQKAYQLLVMRFLIGLGVDFRPLRYRLLPTTRFINFGMFEARIAAGLDVANTTALHCGYLNTYADKYEHLDAVGALERGLAAHARYVAALRGLPAPALGSHRKKLLRLRRKNRTTYSVYVR